MNLLEKAKVITTPTAYSNGILHSVKPSVVWETFFESNYSNTAPYPNPAVSGLTVLSNQSVLGVDDVLKCTSTISGNPYFYTVAGISTIQRARISFDYYIPSGQSCGAIRVGIASPENDFTTTGEWATATFEQFESYGFLIFRALGADIGDVFYLKNLKVEEDISADFTFTRNSSATRVGEDGYIQDVQIIGGELVQNGDFEEIGSELITNGDFSDGSTGWASDDATLDVSNNTGKVTVTSNIEAGIKTFDVNSLIQGKQYKLTFDIVSATGGLVSGTIKEYFSSYIVGSWNGVGSYTIYFTYQSSLSQLRWLSLSSEGDILEIDNVSLKEVGQNWTFGDGWSIANVNGNQVAISDGSQTAISNLSQSNVTTIGKKYRLTFTVSSISGAVELKGSAVYVRVDNLGIGTHTLDIIADASYIRFLTFAGSTITINNLSVKEITDDTNLPRINYEGFSYENGLPIYGSGKGHFLLEGQSTNLVNYSEDFSNVYWTKLNLTESSSFLSPSGNDDAYKITENTASGAHTIYSSNIGGLVNGTDYTYSVFVKYDGRQWIRLWGEYGSTSLQAYFDVQNGVIGSKDVGVSSNIEDYGNGWYRIYATANTDGTNGRFRIYLSDVDGGFSYQGNGTSGAYIWGAMFEQGNISSYIPTNGSVVTRAAETCNNAGNADLFDSEGVLYAEIAALANDGTNRFISISDDGGANVVRLYYSTVDNEIKCWVKSAGVTSAVIIASSLNILDFNKIAVRYKENDFSLWVNGIQIGTDTSGSAPTGLIGLEFDDGSGANDFYGKTKMVGVFPYLSNDEMECLTGEGYGSFGAMALANNYTVI